jgi:predicted nucleic acid-binding protein
MMLVDTSVWIDFFNGFPSREAERLRLAITENESIVVPGLVLTEILTGLKNDAEAERIPTYWRASNPRRHSTAWATPKRPGYFGACRSKGVTIRSTIDCLIAQLCLRYRYILLAKDRDFRAIARCFPLDRVFSDEPG